MYHIMFPQRSNRASWAFIGQLTDLNNNLLDLSSLSLEFDIYPQRGSGVSYGGGGFYGDSYGEVPFMQPILCASTANGKITILSLGIFRWFFSTQDMGSLRHGTYPTGMIMTSADGTQTEQVMVGPLPIIGGYSK